MTWCVLCRAPARTPAFDISDRISLTVVGDDAVWDAAMTHQQLVMSETLAVQFGAGGAGQPLPPAKDGAHAATATLDGGRTVELLISAVETAAR